MSKFRSLIIRIFGITSIATLFAQYIAMNDASEENLENVEQSRQLFSPYLSPQLGYFSIPFNSARWLSVKPFNDNTRFSPFDKRDSSNNQENGAQREIRSPLGTMRFGKRSAGSPLGTMRFGKREYDETSQLGNKLSNSMMRFGKRSENSPLGTMRFGKRGTDESFSNTPLGTMRFGKRSDDSLSNSPLGTMRFGKRQYEESFSSNPTDTIHFEKRSYAQVEPLQIVERSEGPLGTMRFGK